MTKSVKKAYFLWLVGGVFGFHHIYLGRDKQALVWFSTFGGFLIGLICDLFKIPEYVRESNEDTQNIEKLKQLQSELKAPIFMESRFIGSIAVGFFYSFILKQNFWFESAVDTNESLDYSKLAFKLFSPLVVSLIVYLIGTEGPYKCDIKWPIIGSSSSYLIESILNLKTDYNCALLSTVFLNWNIEWDCNYFENKKKKKLIKRIFFLLTGYIAIAFLISIFIWNNATVEIDGKKILLKDSLKTFWNSKEVVQLREALTTLWNFYKVHGLSKLINHFFYGQDPEAIARAYKVCINQTKLRLF
jgi:DnaJ family protein C protein 22